LPRRRAALLVVAALVLALAGTQTGASDPDGGSAAALAAATVAPTDRGDSADGPDAPSEVDRVDGAGAREQRAAPRDLHRLDGLVSVEAALREQRTQAPSRSEGTDRAATGTAGSRAWEAAAARQASRAKRAGGGKAGQGQAGDGKAGQGKAGRGKRGRRGPKVVHLTFDDGPSPYTRRVLRILTQHDATATFFVLGSQAERHPELLRAVRRQGSNLGHHSHDHPVLTRLSDRALRQQLRPAVRTGCFRPPYGATNRRVVRLARERRLRQVMWTADSRDWEKPGERAIRRNSLLDLHRGSIILMHDGGGDRTQTVAALPGLLKELRRRGYAVRALPSC
jgi:peptidoglycan/xylan/chitin deacetylase (PgdA/CDA1 family)